ncbi:hypothetical protein PtB15_3B74 [Puccinia triticina]|nr:hypothetical protein PtB15_3B74 [Puccinia triticina]
MEIEPFLLWINGVEIFFTAKEITKDKDKILIVGRLISETNLLLFYQSQASSLLGRSWTVAKEELFDAALSSQWLTSLERQIRYLKMGDSETFAQYTTRARTLQRMVSFDKLEHEVNKLDLLKRSEFQFKEFVQRTGNCYDALPKKTTQPRVGAPAATPQHSSNTNNVPREEYIWRIHLYLDSIGKCHHCKQYCGYAAGTCPGTVYRGPVGIPPNFIVPPKPADYVAPRAWTKAQAAGSKPGALQPGRPTGQPAGVASVAEDANTPVETPAILDKEFDFDEYHAAAVSTLTDIEASLANETDARVLTARGSESPDPGIGGQSPGNGAPDL